MDQHKQLLHTCDAGRAFLLEMKGDEVFSFSFLVVSLLTSVQKGGEAQQITSGVFFTASFTILNVSLLFLGREELLWGKEHGKRWSPSWLLN